MSARGVLLVLLASVLAVLVLPGPMAHAGRPIGLPFVVGDEVVPTVEPAVAYNTIWDEYLVVWQNDRPGNDDIYAQRVDKDGALLGGRRVITWGTGTERRYPRWPTIPTLMSTWSSGSTKTWRPVPTPSAASG